MRLFSWLRCLKPNRSEIVELQNSIRENDLTIEATKPIVEEATKRIDDGYYRLRSKTSMVARRAAYEGSLLNDLNDGWRVGHGR